MRRLTLLLAAFVGWGQPASRPYLPLPPVIVGVYNQSSLPDATVEQWVSAIQHQVDRDLRPAWHVAPRVVFGAGDWPCTVEDATGTTDTNGNHDVGPDGPRCVAVDSVTLSHEILEMSVDPYLDAMVVVAGPPPLFYAFFREICDPVAGYTYAIDGVKVSDFVLPAYFWGQTGQRDYLGLASAGMQPTVAGYQMVQTLTSWTGVWGYAWGAQCAFGCQ